MCFSRILHWLLARFHQATMALLTGFLFGSLVVVWPWKRVLSWIEGSHGQLKPAQQVPVSPVEFSVATGLEAQVGLCLVLMLVGFALVWFIHGRWCDTAGSWPPVSSVRMHAIQAGAEAAVPRVSVPVSVSAICLPALAMHARLWRIAIRGHRERRLPRFRHVNRPIR